MTFKVRVDKNNYDVFFNAAKFLRSKYKISKNETVGYWFYKEFGLKFIQDQITHPDLEIEFPSESDYLVFVLRWS